jgi:hypothetical protein
MQRAGEEQEAQHAVQQRRVEVDAVEHLAGVVSSPSLMGSGSSRNSDTSSAISIRPMAVGIFKKRWLIQLNTADRLIRMAMMSNRRMGSRRRMGKSLSAGPRPRRILPPGYLPSPHRSPFSSFQGLALQNVAALRARGIGADRRRRGQ